MSDEFKEIFCVKCGSVFSSRSPSCCGDTELFDPAKHGHMLVSSSNAWKSVIEKWRNHPLYQEEARKAYENGCFSAATILNSMIERLIEEHI